MAGLLWADRCALYERVGRPVLAQGDMPSNAQAAGRFQLVIFDGPLEVDWNVGPLSLARRAPSHVLLFARAGGVPLAVPPRLLADERRAQCQERLVFVWAMAPIAIKYIARRQTHRAISQIGLVRDDFIALWRLVETAYRTSGALNQPLEPAFAAVRTHDRPAGLCGRASAANASKFRIGSIIAKTCGRSATRCTALAPRRVQPEWPMPRM